MRLEEFFDFLTPDDIRIKGSRIGVESVLYEYVHNTRTAEGIKERFPTLTLEQVYATILYYLHDPKTVGAYLASHLDYCRKARAEYNKNPPPGAVRLRQIVERLEAYPPDERARALQEMLTDEKPVELEPAPVS